MENKILVVKNCDNCIVCPCRMYSEETDIARCHVTMQEIPEGTKVPEWCPLKPITRRMSEEGVSIEFIQGWNAAIDMIELG